MIGAIIGDFCGSIYERRSVKWDGKTPPGVGACRLTDDSVLTFATAETILSGQTGAEDFARSYMRWARDYPGRGYGRGFSGWVEAGELTKNDSFGNGSAMRVSPVGWSAGTLDEALDLAKTSAEYTHGHPEGLKGAQAVAGGIFLLRSSATNDELKSWIESTFGYDLSGTVRQIAADYRFDSSCQGSVPQAIMCFLEADSFEGAIKNAFLLNGDVDTQADMAAALAQVRFGVPEELRALAERALDDRMKKVLSAFESRFVDA
jgi:ADP-ribosylglycohydrolase